MKGSKKNEKYLIALEISFGMISPLTIAEMAKDSISFIKALEYDKVDIIGFSM